MYGKWGSRPNTALNELLYTSGTASEDSMTLAHEDIVCRAPVHADNWLFESDVTTIASYRAATAFSALPTLYTINICPGP